MMTTRNMNSGTTKTSVSKDHQTDRETGTDTTIATLAATATTTTTKATTMTIKTTELTKTLTTITSDPGILCFHHCNVKVFCFTLPHICPQCKMALATHPNGDANAAGRTASSGGNRQKYNSMMKLKNNNTNNNNNNNSNNNNTIVDQCLPINSNKDDNDANNVTGENKNCNNSTVAAVAVATSDGLDNSDDEHDDNDLNRNCFTTSNIMASSRLLPFRLPYPFVRANQYPCAIVLRPTTGDFLNDYNNTTDLHIAVTTSTGCVVEFDRHGLRRQRTVNMSEWWQCLLVGDVPEPWYDYWDQVLFEVCQQPDKWTVAHYNEDKHNCYTFVLTFLQALTYDKLSEAATSKTRFCEKYIVPRTTTAGKYISLYRKLRDAGIYVHHANHHKMRYAQQEQQQQPDELRNTANNLTETATTSATKKNNLVTNRQQQEQQHLSSHHSHHSIISRPHSTLCTIEE